MYVAFSDLIQIPSIGSQSGKSTFVVILDYTKVFRDEKFFFVEVYPKASGNVQQV